MHKTNLSRKKYFYLSLSIFSLLIGITGFISLKRSPYLGLDFEARNGKWFITSFSGERAEEMIGAEIAAVNDFRIREYDLAEESDYIPDRESVRHMTPGMWLRILPIAVLIWMIWMRS